MIYYAHSMRIYNTFREQQELTLLQKYFGEDVSIYNPNCAAVQQSATPMLTCFNTIRNGIVGLAFSHSFQRISSGVYAEIRLAQKLGLPIYKIDRENISKYQGILKLTKKDKTKDWARA